MFVYFIQQDIVKEGRLATHPTFTIIFRLSAILLWSRGRVQSLRGCAPSQLKQEGPRRNTVGGLSSFTGELHINVDA